MNNRMISFGLMMTMDSRPSSSPPLKMLTITLTMLLESSMTFCWCKLCDEPHDPNTCEYILVAKEVVEGNKMLPTIVVIKHENHVGEVFSTMNQSQISYN